MTADSGAKSSLSAAVLVIGDEILSGRTQDTNLAYIATWLGQLGIPVVEARVVSDDEQEIGAALNALRAKYSYVFTTGGIGPTHDDITADSVAKAFGLPISEHPEAVALLEKHYAAGDFNAARRRMTRTPVGATLIDNPISKAPGFQIGNVFVMAGIPRIMQAMLESLRPRLTGGPPLTSRTISVYMGEGKIAAGLGAIQKKQPRVSIGSYPFYRNEKFGTSLVVRGTDPGLIGQVVEDIRALATELGAEPFDGEPR
jgi:molybdenum cofactor synthesis domain-containing protein